LNPEEKLLNSQKEEKQAYKDCIQKYLQKDAKVDEFMVYIQMHGAVETKSWLT
jgi:hypothetical protein